MNLAQRIEKLRKDNSFTQEEVAKAMGVNRITIHLWETGKSKPSFKNRRKLADFYKISKKYLVD